MSATNGLIEKIERESNCRVDDNEFDNPAIWKLLGCISRELGKSPRSYTERDDMAAGALIMHRKEEDHFRKLLVNMLIGGADPDALGDLFKKE